MSEARALAIQVIVAAEFSLESRSHATARLTKGLCNEDAAIRLELKGAGKPIPANDLWTAALSGQHAIPVMSRDSHFDIVGGLKRQAS